MNRGDYDLPSPETTYLRLVEALLRIAGRNQLVSANQPYAKDLILQGQKYVSRLLTDQTFAAQFTDPVSWYYGIAQYSFCGGAYYAHFWHNDYDFLAANDLYPELIRIGAIEAAIELLSMDVQDMSALLGDMFEVFLTTLQEPKIAKAKNKQDHIFNGLLAFFHAGMTVMLSKEGM